MRRSEIRKNLLMQGNEVLGISLGFDFTAEHEWGIKGIKKKLGMPEEVKSWKNLVISNSVYARHHLNEDETNWSFITTVDASENVPGPVYRHIHEEVNKDFLNCWWDGDDFLIVFNWAVDNTMETEFNQLYELFKSKKMMLVSGPVQKYLGAEGYEVGGLAFVDSTRIPKDVLIQIDKEIKDGKNLQKNVDKSGIIKEVKAKQKEWREQYPKSMNTPWDYFALSPRSVDDENTEYDFVFWLNPRHQDVLHSGWFTVEDVKDWLNEEGKIIGEGWDRLKFECKNGPFYAFTYEYEHYNFYSIRHMRTWRKDNYDHTKLLKTKLDNDMIEKVEGHIKWIIKDHIGVKNYYRLGQVPIGEIDFSIDRGEKDRVFGFLESLDFYGIGTFEAVNTPKKRENFSWWSNILENETVLELVKEHYPTEINMEWYETKKD